jgi:pyridoxine 5-phosphate synthase
MRFIRLLRDSDIRVSLFIDPDLDQVRAAHKLDAHAIELHTGRYAEAQPRAKKEELARLRDAAKLASKLEIEVAAGHGLHYQNTIPVAQILEIEELNIGHSIVARALMTGMESAVRDMLAIMKEARP